MNALRRLLIIGFFGAFFITYLSPIEESDFFYHLSAGSAILAGKRGFSFFGQSLGQIILYWLWHLAGYKAIVLLRAVLYTGLLFILYNWMRRERVGFYERVFFILIPAHLFVSFPSERPQIFGFVFFALILYFLERARADGKTKALYSIPILIFIWSMTHQTFFLGIALSWIYLLSKLVESIRERKAQRGLIPLGIVSILPILVFSLMPGFWEIFRQALRFFFVKSSYQASVTEYLSPVSALRAGEVFPSYWLFLAITGFFIIKGFRKISPLHIVLLSFFGILPFWGLRFMPFFVVMTPIIAIYTLRGSYRESRAMLAGFFAVLVLWIVFVPRGIGLGISKEFPERAVQFFKSTAPKGKIFNYQGWAGYLIWSLPEESFFMPVEGVTQEIDEAYEKILWAESSSEFGKPQWRALLDAYGIDIIIMPGMSPSSGEIFSLIDAIQNDAIWFLIYQDDTANILVRATPSNSKLITLYSLPKKNIYLQIIAQAKRYISKEPRRKVLWRSLGDAYLRLGEVGSAQEAYKKAQGL